MNLSCLFLRVKQGLEFGIGGAIRESIEE